MAKYKVKFSCGHESEVVLYGKTSIRERKLKFFEREGLCGNCYKEKEKERIQKETEYQKELSKLMGLPELEGTPKQVDWAITIRGKMISNIVHEMIKYEHETEYLNSLEQAYDYLTKYETSAKFYIDWRGAKPDVICNVVREKLLRDKDMRDRLNTLIEAKGR